MAQQQGDEIQPLFNQLAQDPDAPDSLKQLMQAVVTILNGSRDPSLAEGPTLDPVDAAEVLFLIERLRDRGAEGAGGAGEAGED